MHTTIRKTLLPALLAAGAATSAQAGILQGEDIGNVGSASLAPGPGGAASRAPSKDAPSANGCGGSAQVGAGLCFSDGQVALPKSMPLQLEPQIYAIMLGGVMLMGALLALRKGARI